MESTTLSDIQKLFRTALSGHYPEEEIRQIFLISSEHVLNYSKIDTFLKAGDPISDHLAGKFHQILSRLKNWEPIQYITGNTTFYGLKFLVDSRVLIPRQETEELVHWIIKSEKRPAFSLLDIGTGSGCIAVSLATGIPGSAVSACDISGDALMVAAENATINKARVNYFTFDVLDDHACLPAMYEVIVSNPPYVRESEKDFMLKNVTFYEPGLALFVNDNEPLLYYKRIALLSRKFLKDGGSLYFEINEHFPEEIMKLLRNTGFYAIEIQKDINGKSRMVRARK